MGYFDMRWRLCACRVNAGYTQKEIAEILGVSEFTIINWEIGKCSPKTNHAQRLSELYGIPLAYMDFSKDGNRIPFRERMDY